MYDVVGDIHGHALELKSLLKLMGYKKFGNSYGHPERKVLFLGDYIDRGPEIPETLDIVRNMVESGNAIALMGNHEYNAVCVNTMHPEKGSPLRQLTPKNLKQHEETLLQFATAMNDYDDYIQWFSQLPLYFENEFFRAVHATWHQDLVNRFNHMNGGNRFSSQRMIVRSASGGEDEFEIVDVLLKGKEIDLPAGISFTDKDGNERKRVGVKWWMFSKSANLKELSLFPVNNLPDVQVKEAFPGYDPTDKPVFFGHYWMKGLPNLQAPNVCCLDYSVAKGGHLVAYRHDSGSKLNTRNIVWVNSR
jgi:hypothetical protein